jgi:oligopeptide transport system permease protein
MSSMLKYILKRIGLLLVTFLIIMVICFVMIKSLPLVLPDNLKPEQRDAIVAKWTALGYYEPIMVQLGKYFWRVITQWDWGYSWYIDYSFPATYSLNSRLGPTMLINVYSLVFSVPFGILLGIYAALKKNQWQDNIISVLIMVFVSVPSYVYAFLVQYFFCFKLQWFPLTVSSVSDAGGNYFTWTMFVSLLPAVFSLSFGTIAGLARFVRAELTESLTSEYMLLARAKGLTNAQATMRHALNNAMVPILPSILADFVDIIGGSLVIEQIFSVPGVGSLFIKAINMKDYDVYMVCNAFYVFIGLAASILIDLSYGFIDPRIRMGEK